jgi:hypothetical protein
MTALYMYNQGARRLVNKELDYAVLKIMLLQGAAFIPAETSVLTTLSAFEVSGNGWPAGGPTLTGVNIAVVNTDDSRLDANNVNVTATGGDIGPANAAVIYEDTTKFPLLYIDFEVDITAAVGTPFSFFWNSGGIIQFRVPA